MAAVGAYFGMLRSELHGVPYSKAAVIRDLREGALAGRNHGSVSRRMHNISATLYDLRIPHIIGYAPLTNVGSGVKERIKAAFENLGISEFQNYASTSDFALLSARVNALRLTPIGITPQGATNPAQVTKTTTSFVRDPAVKRWVLNFANGQCEGCDLPAPFSDYDGYPYLEVHHVIALAHRGSDRVTNAVALCPNCHRRCHFSIDRDEFKLLLYEKIERLRVEVPGNDEIERISLVNLD
jgi:5-methylcytosine-specific restriction protein A